jgi:anti-anti-sigma factor
MAVFEARLERAQWKSETQVLRLSGRLDTQTVGILEELLEKNAQLPPHRWALDLAGLDYVSSAGISALVGLLYRLQPMQGSLCFFSVREKVGRIFNVLGLNESLPFFSDEAAAKASF